MNGDRERMVARAMDVGVRGLHSLSGGSFSDVCEVSFEDGSRLVAKFARSSLLEEEAAGLDALRATGTVRVPEVHALEVGEAEDDGGVLLMERFVTGGSPDWHAFGRDLAALHGSSAGERYGFTRNNHLGATPQSNRWTDDWVLFNREQRHGFLVEGLARTGALLGEDLRLVERVLADLDAVLPQRPFPSLLHGDLWSGNALALEDGGVAVIDPAPSVGDGLADIAMMQLFGGFPDACFEGYRDGGGVSLDPASLSVYRLYHLLNHLRLFGAGYLAGVLRECRLILGATA